jgi:purine-binding chemotaxis protein CheW
MIGWNRDKQRSLRSRLSELQSELHRVQEEMVSLGSGEELPGMHALVHVGEYRALIPVDRVKEIVRLVAFAPLPSMPEYIRGSFVCRGQPVIAVDLASLLGVPREPDLDAHILIVTATRPFGLIVDGVRSLVNAPVLVQGGGDLGSDIWRGSGLTVGLCRVGQEILPLLSLAPIDRHLGEVLR